jgi:hypothetical protein
MNGEELAQMKDGKGGGKGKGAKGSGKGSGKANGKSTPGWLKPERMLCSQFRDTGACTNKECKYLHVTKEEYAKLTVFCVGSHSKGAKGGAAVAGNATSDKKKKNHKAKKSSGAVAAATDLAA